MAFVWQTSFFGVTPTTCANVYDCDPFSQYIDGEITARGTGPLSFNTNPFTAQWNVPNTDISFEYNINFDTPPNYNQWSFKIYINNQIFKEWYGGNAQNISSGNFCFGLDETNHKAFINPSLFWEGVGWRQTSLQWSDDDFETLYNAINNIVTYTWQSVAGVSGKGQTYNLSQIASASINNGESVTGASASAFTSLSDSTKVSALVDVQELDDSKARVVYKIPSLASGSYSYAKLTYKQGHIPTNKDDGTSADLDITSFDVNKTIDVSGIVTGSIYWFVIFTDKSESEPVKLGENNGSAIFFADMANNGRDSSRYDASKTIGNHKQGELWNSSGNPGYTISDGVLDVTSYGGSQDISWSYDSTENPKNIPANCTLTFEYDCFFPTSAGYLDWYVNNSNNEGVIYWCFDTKHTSQADKWYNCKVVCKVVNGVITRYKYVLDGAEIYSGGSNINMPCTDTENSVGISLIYFNLTTETKFKNMSIYYDFSEYHDGGGSGSGSSGST